MINISAFETFCDQELFKMQMLQIIHVQRNYIFGGCQLRYLIAKKNCRVLNGRKIWAGNLCLFSRLTGYLSEVIQHLWALLKTLGISVTVLLVLLLGEPNELLKWFPKNCFIHLSGLLILSWSEQQWGKAENEALNRIHPFPQESQIHIMEKCVQYAHLQLTQKQ